MIRSDYLTVDDLAEMFGTTTATIRGWVQQQRFPANSNEPTRDQVAAEGGRRIHEAARTRGEFIGDQQQRRWNVAYHKVGPKRHGVRTWRSPLPGRRRAGGRALERLRAVRLPP